MVSFSPEQERVIQCDDDSIIVDARAGTGKTSTQVGYAEKRRKLEFLYLAYNKAIQEEAKTRFPSNVVCRTIHSVAYAAIGHRYREKMVVGNMRVADVAEMLGVRTNFNLAGRVLETLNAFLASDRNTILEVVDTSDQFHRQLAEITQRFWERMSDEADPSVPMLHDGYLKLFQLSRPSFSCDVLLLDEYQDANPVTSAIVHGAKCRKLYVGDPHQQIYQFRGAVNMMSRVKGEHFYLTGSWRFGPEIADVANCILSEKGERIGIRGMGESGVVDNIVTTSPYAIICRTNSAVFDAAISVPHDRGLNFIGGIAGYRFDTIEAAHNLCFGLEVRDRYIKKFEDFALLEKCALDTEDPELKALVKTVEKYGRDIPEMIASVKRRVANSNGDDIVIMTAHKSKGLEFGQVMLANDFIKPTNYRKARSNGDLSQEDHDKLDTEMNLLYVAATRARKVLQPNDSIMELA